MDKAVLISIRPQWIVKIARGEKTIEVRKTRPNLSTPFKCYIYCTKAQNPVLVALQNLEDSPYVMTCGTGNRRYPVEDATWARLLNGTVCGEFTCHTILPITVFDNGSIKDWNYWSLNEACMSYEDMADYIGHGKQGYGWRIADLKIYEEPKELSELHHDCSQCGYVNARWDNCDFIIKRPPQSWCYVKCHVEEI